METKIAKDKVKDNKTLSAFESAFYEVSIEDVSSIDCDLAYVKQLRDDRVLLITKNNGNFYRSFGFMSMMNGITAPCKVSILLEKRTANNQTYWNTTAITRIN